MGARGGDDHPKSIRLDTDHVRMLLRLWGQVHRGAATPAERKRRLILGLCDALGAYAGTSVVTLLDPHTGLPEVVSVVRATAGAARLPPVPWHGSPGVDGLLAPRGGIPPIESSLGLGKHPTLMASLKLMRANPARPPTSRPSAARASTGHAVATLDLVHKEARLLYAADLALASPPVRGLPDRERHVLQYLLAGEAEADVARHMGVGVQSVRRDAKAACRRLGAADYHALLARWLADP